MAQKDNQKSQDEVSVRVSRARDLSRTEDTDKEREEQQPTFLDRLRALIHGKGPTP